ncbi:reverse transcriptase domain-containing protein [Tanacetum coccineum]
MKLNPKKITFGVEEGMFLGYKVNTKGLKVWPNKVDDVLSLPSPKSGEAFKQMKQLIMELPMLTAPMEKEELIVYLAAVKETVSAVLMMEIEAKQMPIYFVRRALRGPEINYTSIEKPRVSVKGQILADFIVERLEEGSPDTLMEIEEELHKLWILFMDGSSCIDGSGAELILTNPEGMEFTYALRFRFDATNNEVEYEALISRLRITEQMGVKIHQANVDSRLVANQVNETYVAKEVDMTQYLEKVRTLTSNFKAFSIRQIPRSENKKANALSKITSISFTHLSKQVLIEELKEKSIREVEILAVVEEEEDTWMTPIFEFLTEETLPADVKQARAVRRKSQRFAVINGILYKKSFLGPWLRIGYYWPTMRKDDRALIRACQDCQVHKPVPRNLQQKLTPITSPWPFYKWGIDIAGPFLEGPGKVKFLIVAMDYFTKWIEAKPVATITDQWLCRKSEPQSMRGDKSEVGCREQELDGRTFLCSMGTLHHDKVQQWRHSILIDIRNGSKLREQAAIRKAKSKAKMEKYYNSKVQCTSFKPGDLVYRNNDASRAKDTEKLGPKWQGPYKVTEALRKGVYKLRDRDGKQLPWTWNVSNLKKCYIQKM